MSSLQVTTPNGSDATARAANANTAVNGGSGGGGGATSVPPSARGSSTASVAVASPRVDAGATTSASSSSSSSPSARTSKAPSVSTSQRPSRQPSRQPSVRSSPTAASGASAPASADAEADGLSADATSAADSSSSPSPQNAGTARSSLAPAEDGATSSGSGDDTTILVDDPTAATDEPSFADAAAQVAAAAAEADLSTATSTGDDSTSQSPDELNASIDREVEEHRQQTVDLLTSMNDTGDPLSITGRGGVGSSARGVRFDGEHKSDDMPVPSHTSSAIDYPPEELEYFAAQQQRAGHDHVHSNDDDSNNYNSNSNNEDNDDDASTLTGDDYDMDMGTPDHDDVDEDESMRTWDDVQQAREELEHLTTVNKQRIKSIAILLHRERTEKQHQNKDDPVSALSGLGGAGAGAGAGAGGAGGPSSAFGANGAGIQTDYVKLLDQLHLLWDQLDRTRAQTEQNIDKLTQKLDAEDSKCMRLHSSLLTFKREIAKESRDESGRPMNVHRVHRLEQQEEEQERQLADQRLQHFTLLSQLAALTHRLKEKEKMAEGLHFIDFEQLKIENSTLGEKIEERNEEIGKMKKKTMAMVRVLTHVREKCEGLKMENEEEEEKRVLIEDEVQSIRNRLKEVKKRREMLRRENEEWKKKEGFVGVDRLVYDFEEKRVELDRLREDTNEARQRYVEELKAKQMRDQVRQERAPSASSGSVFGGGASRSVSRHGGGGTRVSTAASSVSTTMPSRPISQSHEFVPFEDSVPRGPFSGWRGYGYAVGAASTQKARGGGFDGAAIVQQKRR